MVSPPIADGIAAIVGMRDARIAFASRCRPIANTLASAASSGLRAPPRTWSSKAIAALVLSSMPPTSAWRMASSQCDFATPTASFRSVLPAVRKEDQLAARILDRAPRLDLRRRDLPQERVRREPAPPFGNQCAGCGSERNWSSGSSRPRNAGRPRAVRCARSEQAREEAPDLDEGQRHGRAIPPHQRCAWRSRSRLCDGRIAPYCHLR